MAKTKKKVKRYSSLNRPRKTARQSWLEKDMELAIKAVRGTIEGVERIGYLIKASQLYKVPRSTLERINKNSNKIAIGARKFLGNRKSVLPEEVERKLANYVKTMEEKLFGLTYIDLRKMAYELAEANSVEHNFNKKDRMAGKY